MLTLPRLFILFMSLLLVACVNFPTGPSVMTLPGAGKSFEQFRFDDYECRQFAYEQIGGTTAQQASTTSGIQSTAISTGLGAAAGAALGGGRGAAVGAGAGLLMGGLLGSESARTSGYAGQERYDMGYIQCMYAKGHRVPVSGQIMSSPPTTSNPSRNISNPPSNFIPPPPPTGNPPPPPPR